MSPVGACAVYAVYAISSLDTDPSLRHGAVMLFLYAVYAVYAMSSLDTEGSGVEAGWHERAGEAQARRDTRGDMKGAGAARPSGHYVHAGAPGQQHVGVCRRAGEDEPGGGAAEAHARCVCGC